MHARVEAYGYTWNCIDMPSELLLAIFGLFLCHILFIFCDFLKQIIGKSWEKTLENVRQFLGHFYGKFMEIIGLKFRGVILLGFGLLTLDLLMGEPENLYFYDFGTFGRVPSPKTIYFYLLRHLQNDPRKNPNSF